MRFLRSCVILLALASAGGASANSEGPMPGLTGAPLKKGGGSEMNCQSCHMDYALNPDALGRIQLLGAPAVYEPGKNYVLTLQLNHPTAKRWGFQLTALTIPAYDAAGDFAPNDKTTQKSSAEGRQYIEHGAMGGRATGIGKTGGYAWSFTWTAPKDGAANVAFFAAANMANGNGDFTGDRIYASGKPIFTSKAPAKRKN
ncbi:choice-of-anchor V domain-containing protein [Sphingosinicella microcystinivorans]|uniref:choice-of-anchor V domain-containing protein n=1 Tax=Sphingosinicella microcystinivorans TaxID=335406 RepID=UPI0022F3FC8B|nr:choice-of-anchor V domain-containing protein [Sphingosinicella microcystinivorans]WBX85783.1 hypothetical protein PE061_07705 [Sphingosinicella microcystinivorans]